MAKIQYSKKLRRLQSKLAALSQRIAVLQAAGGQAANTACAHPASAGFLPTPAAPATQPMHPIHSVAPASIAGHRENARMQSCRPCSHPSAPVPEPADTPLPAMRQLPRYCSSRLELLSFVQEPLLPRLLELLENKTKIYAEINELLSQMGVAPHEKGRG
uniref:Uncharacterized protein n=1 Tax=Myoviridae sp. ctiv53 TaxID=2827703 RepID=A0A8S5THT4_9CAUD|nr:MAG TPA: hypothetical protein [Myoviridae sp. ctiv53]